MKKKDYIMPNVKVVSMTTIHMLTVSVKTEEYSYNKFTLSRESSDDWEDDEEEDTGGWFK